MDYKEQINFYCDESCYLEHDRSRYMILGMVFCPKSEYSQINKKFIELKNKYNINKNAETKWSKLSSSKFLYYKELIEYFFDINTPLSFNGIVVDKHKLKHKEFNQTHNEFYYKIMYLMINYKINPFNYNKIYIDEKDTHNTERIKILEEILKNHYLNFSNIIKPIQVIKSTEIQIMQLTDILTGAISYELNNSLKKNNSKVEIISLIQSKILSKFKDQKNISSSKFDLMFFRHKEQYHE